MILHSFVECEEAKSFFDEVISWFNKTNNSKYSPTMAEKLFGMLHNGNDKKLPKVRKKSDFNEFIKKLLLKVCVENLL